MKNKILAMLVAFGLVGSVSAIEINENLSINGFIDGSISKTDNAAAGTDEADWGIDEIEVNFLFNVGSVSGQVDVDTEDADNDSGLSIEQAHFTYSLENGISLTFGRYGSALGLEREDPAGLSTFSRAYGNAFNLGDADSHVSEGLKISYAADVWSIGVSIENPDGTIRNSGAAKDDLDFEVALAYTGVENLNVGIGFFSDNQDTAATEVDVTNIHATYQVGKALLGAEYTQRDGNGVAKGDLDATMFLIDYDVSDKLGVAVRYSTYENGTAGVDVDKVTIAPNYAITESLGAILEYSDTNAAAGDSDEIALELTYTF
jgi:hypothetical protein